eukprot:8659888-Alexandrium_andersonii.AAC.1
MHRSSQAVAGWGPPRRSRGSLGSRRRPGMPILRACSPLGRTGAWGWSGEMVMVTRLGSLGRRGMALTRKLLGFGAFGTPHNGRPRTSHPG